MPDPFIAHIIFVPLTLAIGFFIGWAARGAVAARTRKPGAPAEGPRR